MSGPARPLLRLAPAARPAIARTAALAIAAAVLVVVQAALLARLVADAFLGGARLSQLVPVLLALAGVVVARAGLGWAGEASAARTGAVVVADVRARLLDRVLLLGPRHPGLPPPGQLAALAGRGVDGLAVYAGRHLPQRVVAVVVPVLVGGCVLAADPVSAVLLAVTVPLVPVFMVLIGLHTRERVARQWQTLAALAGRFLDVVAGLDVLTAFGRARAQGRRIADDAERYRAETMRTLRVGFLSSLSLEVLASLSVALVAVSVGLRLVSGHLDLATGLLVIVLAPEVFLPLRALAAGYHDSAEAASAADQVLAVLDLPVAAPADPVAAPDPMSGPVRLDAVGVDGRSGPVLDGVSVEIRPGQVLGLTGVSGAGKSTLLDLLLGWRRPDRGRVTVAGVDLADVDRDAWLTRVAWVPQRPVLVRGTVADNLRLAAPHAGPDRLAAAAAVAALDVPLGTPVHERGQGLSTGQQRRVALARALLADRPLVLLDEPTEGLDRATEATLLAALPGALAGRTAVVVSHRAAVLGACDRVVALPEPARTPAEEAADGEPAAAGPGARPEPPPRAAEVMPPSSAPGRRHLLEVLRPHRRRLAVAVLAGTGAGGCAVALAATSAWLISTAALRPPVLSLMVAIVGVRTFALGKAGLRYGERLASHDVALRVLATLRGRVWASLVRLGPAVTARMRSGDLLARLVGDVDAQQDVVVRALVPAASAAVVAVGTTAAFAVLLPPAAAALAAGLFCAGVLAPALTLRAARRSGRREAGAAAAVAAGAVELLDAAPDLLACGAAGRRREALAAADADLAALRRRSAGAAGLGGAVGALGTGAAMVACTALGIAALATGALPGPALAVLALTPLAVGELLAGLPEAARRWSAAAPAADRLAALDHAPAPVTDPASPRPVPPGRSVRADGLSVRWPGAARDAVAGVDLDVPSGGGLVLSGPSGAGKSTVLAALVRTLDPAAGRLAMDEVDLRELTGDGVRSRIAWCGPAPHLFDSTLRENLRLARPDASDEQLAGTLRRAGLGAWAASLPEGLDTPVGRGGGTVSGGERQRIGLARALLADRPLLLLDEPTAHLDDATAGAVAADVLRGAAGRTTVVTSHRPEAFPGWPVLRLPAGARDPVAPLLSTADGNGRSGP